MEEKSKNKNGVKKIFNIIRYVLGAFFILGGLTYFSSSIITAIFLILLGFSIFPILYEKISILQYKYLPIILPIILFFITMSMVPVQENENTNNNLMNETFPAEKKIIFIEDLSFDETDIEIDIKESKDILLKIEPINATNINELKFNSTNSEIIKFEKNTEKSNESEIYAKIQPISEGECEIFVICNNIESNHIKIKIIDNERIEQEKKEKEEQAKKEAEEQAKKQAEEQAKKEAEEQAKKQSQSTSTQKNTSSSTSQTTSSKPSTSSSSSQSNSNNSQGKAVYRTPSGKRYHFDPDCGGKNSYSTTLSAAKSAGLTPCQKCAQ